MITDFARLIGVLSDERVDFVLIGGVALVLHGSSRVTRDLDLCYSRESANLERLAKALRPVRPTLRGAPPELPFLWDARTLASGLNFTLQTDAGEVDLLGEVPGVGDFAHVARWAEPMTLYGRSVLVLGLDGLERSKRAAGRAKDLLDLGEIAAIRSRGRDS